MKLGNEGGLTESKKAAISFQLLSNGLPARHRQIPVPTKPAAKGPWRWWRSRK
jgi:hypothetical protein